MYNYHLRLSHEKSDQFEGWALDWTSQELDLGFHNVSAKGVTNLLPEHRKLLERSGVAMVERPKDQVELELARATEESEEEIEDIIGQGSGIGIGDEDLMKFCDEAWHNLAVYWKRKYGTKGLSKKMIEN